jgi:hypothetical protein
MMRNVESRIRYQPVIFGRDGMAVPLPIADRENIRQEMSDDHLKQAKDRINSVGNCARARRSASRSGSAKQGQLCA